MGTRAEFKLIDRRESQKGRRSAFVSAARRFLKRAVDITVSAMGLVVAGPLMAIAALAGLVTEGRPVLYRQERVGRNGRNFMMLKLRTMVPDAEAMLPHLQERNERDGPLFKVSDDPRITRVGRVLRDTSVDELPQLWNVLTGQMSLVGPRPALPSEVEHFDEAHLGRHLVRPGITGLWQVRDESERSFSAYRELDLWYVSQWTLSLDLRIIVATTGRVLRGMARATKGRARQATGTVAPPPGSPNETLTIAPVVAAPTLTEVVAMSDPMMELVQLNLGEPSLSLGCSAPGTRILDEQPVEDLEPAAKRRPLHAFAE